MTNNFKKKTATEPVHFHRCWRNLTQQLSAGPTTDLNVDNELKFDDVPCYQNDAVHSNINYAALPYRSSFVCLTAPLAKGFLLFLVIE
ncbi:hypothetical protein CHS0354_038367, partial [Potamilus streckersoni]